MSDGLYVVRTVDCNGVDSRVEPRSMSLSEARVDRPIIRKINSELDFEHAWRTTRLYTAYSYYYAEGWQLMRQVT